MIEKYISLGINHFMIIFTTETKEEITEVLKKVKFRSIAEFFANYQYLLNFLKQIFSLRYLLFVLLYTFL